MCANDALGDLHGASLGGLRWSRWGRQLGTSELHTGSLVGKGGPCRDLASLSQHSPMKTVLCSMSYLDSCQGLIIPIYVNKINFVFVTFWCYHTAG